MDEAKQREAFGGGGQRRRRSRRRARSNAPTG
jgi:hypothetical protein